MLNIGSITKLEIAPAANITLGIPNQNNEVTVSNSGTWDEPKIKYQSASLEIEEKTSRAGSRFTSTLKYELPKVGPDNHQSAHKYVNKPLVIRVTDGNGNKYLVGTPQRPVFIVTTSKIPPSPGGFNGYEFEVKTETPHPAYFSA